VATADISTGVDAFISLLKKVGRIEMNDAAASMGVSKDLVEEWAKALEEQGLIKVDYQFTKAFVTWIMPKEEEVAISTTDELKDKRLSTAGKAEGDLAEIARMGQKLRDMQSDYEKVSQAFSARLGGVQSGINLLKELNRQQEELVYRASEINSSYLAKFHSIDGFAEDMENQLAVASASADKLVSRATAIEAQVNSLRQAREEYAKSAELAERGKRLCEELPRKAANIRQGLDAVEKEYANLSKSLEKLSADMKKLDAAPPEVKKKAGKQIDQLAVLRAAIRAKMKAISSMFSEFASQKAAVETNAADAKRTAIAFSNTSKMTVSIGMELDRLAGECAGFKKKAEYVSRDLGSRLSRFQTVKKEFEKKRTELSNAKSGSDKNAQKTISEMQEQIAEASSMVKKFEQRVEKMGSVGSTIDSISRERDALANEVAAVVKEMRDLQRNKSVPMNDVMKKIAESDKKLAGYEQRKEKIVKEIEGVKDSMSKMLD